MINYVIFVEFRYLMIIEFLICYKVMLMFIDVVIFVVIYDEVDHIQKLILIHVNKFKK